MEILIRRVEPGDYKAVQQVHAQPSALRGTLQLPFPSEDMWKKRLEGLGEDSWRSWPAKGVGTALMQALLDLADNWLNLSRLELTVFTDNEAAVKLYQKLGFVIEGTHRKFAFRDGEYVDCYAMARLR